MNGNRPGQSQRILCKTSNHIFFNFIGGCIVIITDVFPFFLFHFKLTSVIKKLYRNFFLRNLFYSSKFSVVVFLFWFTVIFYKHYLRTSFQLQFHFSWQCIFVKVTVNFCRKFKKIAFQLLQLCLVYLIHFHIMGRKRNIIFQFRQHFRLVALIQ